MNNSLPSKEEIQANGIYLKTVYGIAKIFEWKEYRYKGKVYQVSQFDDDVIIPQSLRGVL